MFTLLSSFTEPFLIALLFWPVLAFFLAVPILAIQYRQYGKVHISRGFVAYFGILYLLSLISFTLYPMPSNPVEFCQDYNLSPQLVPFSFIQEIQTDGLRAVFQVSMNLLFFIPLGLFAKLFFNLRLRTTLIIAFLVSLFIEVAQLTGAFGHYPCSYRLFDVNDLIINTAGGLAGYGLATLIPHNAIKRAKKNVVVRRAGLLRYLVSFLLDQTFAYFVTVFILIAVYVIVGKESAIALNDIIFFIVWFVTLNIVPFLVKGWSVGSWVVRLNHDDRNRTPLRRVLFYVCRAVLLTLIVFPPFGISIVSIVIVLFTLVLWWQQKRLVYQYL